MITPYVAGELDAAGCILLCSIRSWKEFPKRYYFDWLLFRHCFPLRLVRIFLIQMGARFLLLFPFLWRLFVELEVGQQMTEIPTRRFAGLSRMMFDWAYRRRLPEENDTPIFSGRILQIHGTRDPLLPIRLTTPDVLIPGGRHTLPLSHPEKVNEIIGQFVDEIATESSSRSTG
ncbi:MAG: alpha/beta hydrolase [Planctomycetaceae bacterium]|nr:alpha/beta hydrolase [Planctomycetaceae bacterium]